MSCFRIFPFFVTYPLKSYLFWSFDTRGDGSVLCQIPDTVAPHFRRVYGYIGAAQTDEKMTSTTTPIQFNVVLCENSDVYFLTFEFYVCAACAFLLRG